MTRITSCDCFENLKIKLEKETGYKLYGLEHIYCIPVFDDKRKEQTTINPNWLPSVKFCPFCGKEIIIEKDK